MEGPVIFLTYWVHTSDTSPSQLHPNKHWRFRRSEDSGLSFNKEMRVKKILANQAETRALACERVRYQLRR